MTEVGEESSGVDFHYCCSSDVHCIINSLDDMFCSGSPGWPVDNPVTSICIPFLLWSLWYSSISTPKKTHSPTAYYKLIKDGFTSDSFLHDLFEFKCSLLDS